MKSVLSTVAVSKRFWGIIAIAAALAILGAFSFNGSAGVADAQGQTPTYTPLSASANSDIIGVDVQLKIAGVTDGCLGLKMDNRGGPEFVRWAHRECNQLSDSQAYKIVAFNGGWQIQGKWALDDGDAYDDCIGKGAADASIEANWYRWHQRLNDCLDATHTHRIQQTWQIEQRSTDSKWVLWTHGTDRGLLDNGLNEFTGVTGTSPMAFDITPVSSLPAPTPEAAVTRTVTENGVSVTYTTLTSGSSLVGTDVQLKMVGVSDACLSIPSGFSLRRTSCDKTDDKQTWKIVQNAGGWQIKSKTTDKGAAFSRCIDGDNALDNNAVLEQEVIFVRDCLADWRDPNPDQTFTIEQRSSDNNWMLWIYPGVGIKDWGAGPLGPSRTDYVAFQIRTIASIPAATPTPTATASATAAPSGPISAQTGHTVLSTSSSLVNTEVRLYPIGLPNGCVDINQYSNPPSVMWWNCDTTENDQIWKIVSFNGGYQIQSKTGAGGRAFKRCMDTGTNAASVTDTADVNPATFSKDCLTSSSTGKDGQTFSIQQRTSDSNYVIFAATGVALKSFGKYAAFGLGKADYLAFDIVPITTSYTAPTHVPATPAAGTTFTDLSATTNSSIIGVDVQLKVMGVTETNSCAAYQSSTNQIYRTTCDTSSDSQAWKIQSFDGEWQIVSKYARNTGSYGSCMDSYGYDARPGEYHLANTQLYTCAKSNTSSRTEYQKYTIRQRSTDSNWVIFGAPGVSFEDYGSRKAFGVNEYPDYVAFQITAVSSISKPPATPSPTATATATPTTPTPTPAPVTYTPLSATTNSDLIGVDVQLQIAGYGNACLGTRPGSSTVRRVTCSVINDHVVWRIESFDSAWQLKFKPADVGGSAYGRCLDEDRASAPGTSIEDESTFVYNCLASSNSQKEEQKFEIEQRSSDNKWVIWAWDDVGLKVRNPDNTPVNFTRTGHAAFDIVTVSSLPTAVPTPTPDPNAPTPVPTAVGDSDLTTDLMDIEVEIKIAGTTGCLAVEDGTLSAGQKVVRATCDQGDDQKWIISQFNSRLRLMSSTTKDLSTSLCAEARMWETTGIVPVLQFEDAEIQACGSSLDQGFLVIQQTSGGDDWWIFSAHGIGLQDNGDGEAFDSSLTTWTVFEIAPTTTSTVSTPATPVATATASPTATPEPTPVAITSDLIGVDVTIKVAGTNDCMDLKYGDAKNGQNMWRYGCNGTAAQTFRIAAFNGGYKIVVKQGNSSYCLDSRGDHTKSDLTGSRLDVWSCVASNHSARDNQTFFIEGAQGSTWHIYSADGVGIKDQGVAQNFTHDDSSYTRFEITAVVGGV